VAPELDGMAEAIDELDGMADDEALAADDEDAEVPELPELHAAAPNARPAVIAETATIRVFTFLPCICTPDYLGSRMASAGYEIPMAAIVSPFGAGHETDWWRRKKYFPRKIRTFYFQIQEKVFGAIANPDWYQPGSDRPAGRADHRKGCGPKRPQATNTARAR
jgi:hypothetical protein